MLFAIKEKRQELSKSTEVKKKSQLGQFFTPERIAVFMANLFADVGGHCCLLDAGAGIGALSAAFLDRWLANNLHFDRINVEAFEIDQTLHANLSDLFKRYRHSENFNATIFGEDFIHKSAEALCDEKSSSLNLYTHAILNPPYKKLHSHSAHRLDLRRVGIETVNLYSAFVALAIARLAPGGQIVAIIPRSFCNEPYYRPFRHFILGRTALRHLHLFESRSRIFKDDAVLQENLIILLERDGHQGPVTISTSTDSTFTDVSTYQHAFDRIVFPDDPTENPLMGITPIMDWAREHYAKDYAPNTRETVRRQTMHQFVDAGLALYNPDKPDRPVNSPKAVYQIEPVALTLLRNFGTSQWPDNLKVYLAARETLAARYAKEREQNYTPVEVVHGKRITLTPGKHNELIRAIIKEFAPRFVPGSSLVYAGDTGDKWGYFDALLLAELGIKVDSHGKMPDVVLYCAEKNWLLLVECVTSHGPVNGKRHTELARLFAESTAGLVYVTAFPNRSIMGRYLGEIAWETEVWVADAPSHLIHFNGERFLGPYSLSDRLLR